MRILPLQLLSLCASVALGKQPVCKLVPQNQLVLGGSTPTGTSGSNAGPAPTLAPFNYNGSEPIRGVNLGGWFVLEPWITPSIFQNTNNDNIVDEYTFGQMQDYNSALAVLKNHWETWIKKDDFSQMRDSGLNHVRIPLGYWSVPLTSSDTNTSTSVAPYIPGAWPYFLQALNWAKESSIHVIVDLHGAPGSQNGYDNSGQRTNDPQWADNPDNVTRTLDTLEFIVKNAGGLIDVVELLNEPAAFRSSQFASTLRQFWKDGYGRVRQIAGNSTQVMIGDGFLGVNAWQDFLAYPDGVNTLMDFHEYQIFSNLELSRTWDEHISFACTNLTNLKTYDRDNINTVIGEWSTASTDCAQWLNGRGVGARWEGKWFNNNQVFGTCSNMTGSYTGFSDPYKEFMRKYWEVQVDVAEGISGWVYWTWKNENADDWSYQKGLEAGWIPKDITQRKYPGLCP